jgi:hypothetical protein
MALIIWFLFLVIAVESEEESGSGDHKPAGGAPAPLGWEGLLKNLRRFRYHLRHWRCRNGLRALHRSRRERALETDETIKFRFSCRFLTFHDLLPRCDSFRLLLISVSNCFFAFGESRRSGSRLAVMH